MLYFKNFIHPSGAKRCLHLTKPRRPDHLFHAGKGGGRPARDFELYRWDPAINLFGTYATLLASVAPYQAQTSQRRRLQVTVATTATTTSSATLYLNADPIANTTLMQWLTPAQDFPPGRRGGRTHTHTQTCAQKLSHWHLPHPGRLSFICAFAPKEIVILLSEEGIPCWLCFLFVFLRGFGLCMSSTGGVLGPAGQEGFPQKWWHYAKNDIPISTHVLPFSRPPPPHP